MYKTVKRVLLPGTRLSTFGCGLAAAALSPPSSETYNIDKVMDIASKEVKPTSNELPKKLRPSELPIYSTYQPEKKEPEQPPSSLEKATGNIRKELWVIYDTYKIYEQKVKEILETGKAHTAESLHFLQEEATDIHRAGAIAVGGLAGLVFGLRGGFFRKVFYSSAAASGMAAICYPIEAKEVTERSLNYAKYYITVSYNFVYGVKPEAEGSIAAGDGLVSSSEKAVLGTETSENSSKATRDQSNPADKDMYTNRQ